jgi:NodT family efflux transporter outer membrane factor (OMF) lipoprotein
MASTGARDHSEFSQWRLPRSIMIMRTMRPLVPTALLACALLLASCAVGPRYQRPAGPAAAGFAPAPLPDSSASAPIHGGAGQHLIAGRDIPFEWWELFQSPALNSLVAKAFVANPTIAAAQAALGQARELLHAQQGFFYPSVGATYTAERHKVSGNTNSSTTIGVQGSGLNKLPQIPEAPASVNSHPRNLPSYYTFYTAALTVGFVPDVFGGNRRQVESLAAQAQAQRFALEATYITLASNVVAAAIQEASVREQIRARRQIIAADEQSLQILRAQFSAGFAMRIAVAALESQLAGDESTLPPLQAQLERTRDLIRALVGDLPNRADESFELEALELPPEMPVSLPGKIIEQRPDVRAAEAQLHSASANVGIAVAAMLPQFSITGEYGGNATQMSQLFTAGGPFWSLYGNLTQPVFQGGTLLHQKRAAGAALKQAAAQYRTTVIAAYQNVADALHVSLSDADTLAADVEAENSAKVTYELTRRQMDVGYVTYLALLSAESAYEQTVLARVEAQAARYGDAVALFQALGGGWWNRREVAAR